MVLTKNFFYNPALYKLGLVTRTSHYKFLIFGYSNRTIKIIRFPDYVSIFKKNNYLFFSSKSTFFGRNLYFFNKVFSNIFKNSLRTFKKKLFLRGLGYKILKSSNGFDCWSLKLGYSHIITLAVASNKIRIHTVKNNMSIESHIPVLLGNFCHKLQLCRLPNSYKEKGFWFKNDKKKLKPVKKS